ncbi:hypothetical protein ACHAW6_001400 [Cyclotella cf. meneghiniana]
MWSPVDQWSMVHTLMILAANQCLVTAQVDVTVAFVHAELVTNQHISIYQPAGCCHFKNMVLNLKRGVYALKQAPRNFFYYLRKCLVYKELGLKQSSWDPCLFVGINVIVVVYMDDILCFVKEDSKIQKVIDALKEKGIAIHHEGIAEGFLVSHTSQGPATYQGCQWVPASGNINYPAVVGILLYLFSHSYPDIAFTVHQVAKYTFKPSHRHELAIV